MALPTNVSIGTVTGQFVVASADGADIDFAPDTYPVQGTVTFTASVPYLPDPTATEPVTILPEPIVCVLDDAGYLCAPDPDNMKLPGRRGVQLIATDDPDLSVTGWTWKVTYSFLPRGKAALPQIPDHYILVPSNGTVDLASVVKVPQSSGVGVDQVMVIRAEALQSSVDAATSATSSAQSATAASGYAAASAGSATAAAASATAAAATYAPIASPTFTGTVSGVSKAMVGLGNADNTADSAKPVSTAQQAALDAKAPLASPTFTGTVAGVTKTHVGLGNVDNTSDTNKPVSTAQATALNAKVTKGDQVINVKDYGAVGDGTTNDAAALQTAFDLAKDNPGKKYRYIFPGGGTYSATQKLYVYSNSDIDLCGSTIRRDFNTGPGGVSLIQWGDNTTNLKIRNGTLDGNGANYPGNAGTEGFNICGGTGITYSRFENVTFKDVVGDHSLDLNGIKNVKVIDCDFLGFKDIVGDRAFSESIQLDPDSLANAGTGTNNDGLTVRGCYFGPSSTAGFGAPGCGVGNHASVVGRTDKNIKIIGNTFDGCTYAGVRPFRWDKVTISDNDFINCVRGINPVPLSSATITPESGKGYRMTGNDFTGCTSPIVFSIPTLGPGNAYSKFKNVTITGNTIDGGSDAITVAFISQLTISGNTISNVTTGVKIGYTDNASITGNGADTMGSNFVWMAETTFNATLAGTGLTATTAITGNTGSNIGYRGVHVNCSAKFTTIVGNTFTNVSTAAATRDGITVDTSANGGMIEGNTILDGGATNKPLKGINVTSTAVNWRIGPNNAYGTTKNISNDSTTTVLTGVMHAGTPEGALVGAVGSMVTRTDGGASTTLYVKQSGTGNTGWIAK